MYEKMFQLLRNYLERSLMIQKFDRDRDKLISKAAFVKVVFIRRFRICRSSRIDKVFEKFRLIIQVFKDRNKIFVLTQSLII
jgi:hypothetical protein